MTHYYHAMIIIFTVDDKYCDKYYI